MNVIIKNENFYIAQDQTDNKSFTIFFDSYNEALIKSITKTRIILGATTTEKYRSLTFKASSVLSFFDFQKELKRDLVVSPFIVLSPVGQHEGTIEYE